MCLKKVFCIITPARRYCDPSCLLVSSFVRTLGSGDWPEVDQADWHWGTDRAQEQCASVIVVHTAISGSLLAEVALSGHFL